MMPIPFGSGENSGRGNLAGPEGLEPPPNALEARGSVHLSYGPEHSARAYELPSGSSVLRLAVLASIEPQREKAANANRDLTCQDIVYSIRVRTEERECINLLSADMPHIDAMAVARGVFQREPDRSVPCANVLHLDPAQLPH